VKKELIDILNKYLETYIDEKERQSILISYLNEHTDQEIIDWNNFNGHIVASGFIYAKEENKFLVLYHKDLKMYLYPGGHVDVSDKNILEAALREVYEETGLTNLEQLDIIPIDIDTHIIGVNERLNLPEHYHFDFRYLFMVDRICDVKIDEDEMGDYKWIDINELSNDINYGKVVNKIMRFTSNNKK